jgi:hypothetical protein
MGNKFPIVLGGNWVGINCRGTFRARNFASATGIFVSPQNIIFTVNGVNYLTNLNGLPAV